MVSHSTRLSMEGREWFLGQIFDRRVQKAMRRLLGTSTRNLMWAFIAANCIATLMVGIHTWCCELPWERGLRVYALFVPCTLPPFMYLLLRSWVIRAVICLWVGREIRADAERGAGKEPLASDARCDAR